MANDASPQPHPRRISRGSIALLCACLLVPGEGALLAQAAPAAPAPAAAKLSPDQLDSLVAPIALYPDSLLAQTLAASTYPLEIIQLQQWLAKNKNLKDKALADAVAKQPWDPAVQAMAPLPDVVKRLADDIQWTTDLGNAFLDQQSDVMDAVQRMRKKAQDKGALASNEQQKVETKVVEQKTVIIVESANPEVIYVPVYSPTVVYPPPVYPYPPIYYPPYPPGAAFVSFTAGVVIGAAIWGGAWGHCGWGHNDIDININNNFNRNTNINTGNIGSGNRGGGNSWSHNSQHRGGAPYSSQATASKYGGSTRGGSRSSTQARGGASASQQGRGTSRGASASQQGRGTSGGASASQQGRGTSGGASASQQGRGSSGGASASQQGRGGASPSASTASSRGGGGGASPSASSASKGGGFGGGSSGFSGSSAKASSSRGSSSYGGRSSGGGGGRRR